MIDELFKIYNKEVLAFGEIHEKFPNDDIHGPLLLNPHSKYSNQKFKLLIVGQETNGWRKGWANESTENESELERQLLNYLDFNLGEKHSASPFWNITRKLENALKMEQYSCAWINLNRFDVNRGRPMGVYEAEISQFDHLVQSEIDIIKPDVCMFFTGPDFDYRLKRLFEEIKQVEIPGFTLRQFCKLEHPQLPKLSFRSYHPNYLRFRGLEEPFLQYFSKLKSS